MKSYRYTYISLFDFLPIVVTTEFQVKFPVLYSRFSLFTLKTNVFSHMLSLTCEGGSVDAIIIWDGLREGMWLAQGHIASEGRAGTRTLLSTLTRQVLPLYPFPAQPPSPR